VTTESITVDGDDGKQLTFALHHDVRVFSTPNGRGMNPAVPVSMAHIQPGDRVLVLGAKTDAGPTARQIVKRPPVSDRTTGKPAA
jgi:hypothetical protein